jgi:branched-subunit amino acid transport protein
VTFWIVVVVVGAATIALKASGPVLLGRRPLGERAQSIVDLLAPVMLTALVVTQTFAGDQEIVLDARVPGVAAAAIAVWRGAPIIVAMVIAGVVTALVRAAGG